MPGSAPASGDRMNISAPPGPAASTIPGGDAKAHLARCEVRDDDGEPADQLLRRIRRADAREDRALLAAEVDAEFQQLVGAIDQFGGFDTCDAQVDA